MNDTGNVGKALSVLYVDQAVSFGGSIIVAAEIIKNVNSDKIRPVFVGEVDKNILDFYIGNRAVIYVIRHHITYAHWIKFNQYLSRLKFRPFLKAGMYLLTVFKFIANLPYIFRLAYVMLKERIDLVHVNNSPDAVIAAVILRKKCIWHIHGVWDEKFSHIEKLYMGRVSYFIAISNFVKAAAVKIGIEENIIRVLHNPVNQMEVTPDVSEAIRRKYNVKAGEKVVGIFGRIIKWKGQKEFINACELVMARMQDVKVMVVGDDAEDLGNYYSEIKEIVDKSKFKDRIIFTGFVQNVAELYSIMDIVVHASIEPEPFGLVITEAMSHGVPVVASNLGAPSEIIDDTVDGILSDPADTVKFSEAIMSLLNDDELRKAMGAKAKEKSIKLGAPLVYVNNIETIYKDVMAVE